MALANQFIRYDRDSVWHFVLDLDSTETACGLDFEGWHDEWHGDYWANFLGSALPRCKACASIERANSELAHERQRTMIERYGSDDTDDESEGEE